LKKGPQRDELNITIQEKEAKLKELTQSTSQREITNFEASLIAAFLVSPEGLDNYSLDNLVGLMVALRQKRLGVGPKQVKDAEGNVICQCPVPVLGNLVDKDIDMDIIRKELALHLMPLVKDEFMPVMQHKIELALCKVERSLPLG